MTQTKTVVSIGCSGCGALAAFFNPTPETACVRELEEETGFRAKSKD
ncbi:MAG: hypothetical protein JW994_00715 [Candidatus Omnitrophica bacterium]|nr:hypothetical protein [Candidatus Omnitrophota bacterium]